MYGDRSNLSRPYNRESHKPDQKWLSNIFLELAWDFRAPWFMGRTGHVSSMAYLIRMAEPKPELSLLNPRVFEQTIADLLTYDYAYYNSGNTEAVLKDGEIVSYNEYAGCGYKGPMNWTPLTQNRVISAVRFEIQSQYNNQLEDPHFLMIAPIDDYHLFLIRCTISRCYKGLDTQYGNNVIRQPMDDYITNIFDNIYLEYPPEILQKYKEECASLDNPELVDEFLPLDWNALYNPNPLKFTPEGELLSPIFAKDIKTDSTKIEKK